MTSNDNSYQSIDKSVTSPQDIHHSVRGTKRRFRCGIKEILLGEETLVMGILNITPDSFYDGGRYVTPDNALERIERMIAEGADMVDIGGESTRPGSYGISEEEELRRVIPVIRGSKKRFDIILSIDTTKARIAEEALKEGASIINDISGLKFEPRLAEIAVKYKAGLILMHTPSRPYDMQKKTDYTSVVHDVINSLVKSVKLAEGKGVHPESIIVDPGFGFGKTADQNLTLLKHLSEFSVLQKPILIGTSRKSFIGKVLGTDSPEERLEGTAATVAAGIMNGASIIRVHDVLYMKRVAMTVD
ncbi:MAG TPA: dihydropteroate synthase, partial [Thermodesulfobacteriota bacterium]|nr:dihydropteroate synthase [Thermodesulfobacteriota bacterium]